MEASGRRLEHGSVEPSWMLDLRCLNRLCSAAGGRPDFDRAINSTMFTHSSPHPRLLSMMAGLAYDKDSLTIGLSRGTLGIVPQGAPWQTAKLWYVYLATGRCCPSLQFVGSKYMHCTWCRFHQLEGQLSQACCNIEPPSLTTRQSADGESARQLAPDEFRLLHLPGTRCLFDRILPGVFGF